MSNFQGAPEASSPQEAISTANHLFNRGAVDAGTAVLERALVVYSDHAELLGYLAWARFGQGQFDQSIQLYERLISVESANPEPHFRRAQVLIARDGYNQSTILPVLDLLDAAPIGTASSPRLWDDLRQILTTAGDEKLLRRAVRLVARHHPGDNRMIFALHQFRRERWRRCGRAVLDRLPLHRILGFLLRFRVFRDAMAQANPDSEAFRRSQIEKFYREGSVGITFPQAPPEMAPQLFAQYMETSKSPWFEWMRTHTPVSDARGHRLLDVGSGPGFIGQHFQWLGYQITALTGSETERVECEQRGMETVICDMHNIPVSAGTYDAVLASHVLEHSVAPLFLLWEIWRVLKPGGLVFVNLPLPIDAEPRRDFPQIWNEADDTYRFEADSLGRNHIPEATYYSYGFPPHLFVLSPYQWKWIFRQAGFRTLAACIETPDSEHWDLEEGLNRLGRQPHHCNQLFVLQRE